MVLIAGAEFALRLLFIVANTADAARIPLPAAIDDTVFVSAAGT